MGRKLIKISAGQKNFSGQTFVEYTLLIGILVVVLVAMTPLIRRSTQSMVKLVADQIGNQSNADQKGGNQGYLVSSYSAIRTDTASTTQERLGFTNYIYSDTVEMNSDTTSNLGFSVDSNN